jgi:SCP-2 sterol transfer family
VAQRAIFTGMARQFDPKFAFGFEGDIVYELEHHGDGRPPERWTIHVEDSRATAVPGGNGDPAVKLRLSVPDFARLVAEEVNPQELFFGGRFHVEGDFQVIARLPEMFGQPPQF